MRIRRGQNEKFLSEFPAARVLAAVAFCVLRL